MGFFDFMTRVANGEPAFQDEGPRDRSKESIPPAEEEPKSKIQKGVESTFPVVYIKRTKVHLNGDRVRVYCLFVNKWLEEVELDKIRLFNTKRELDTVLGGGGERELLVYDGPSLTHEDHEVQLIYKTRKGGDYFEAILHASFTYHPEDKTFVVRDIHLSEPIRDING